MVRLQNRLFSGSIAALITIPVNATAQYFSEGLIDPGLILFFALVMFFLFFLRGRTFLLRG